MASLLAYGACQTVCNVGVVACYATAGLTFGTVTGGLGAPAAAVACNALQGTCMSACAAQFLVAGAAETAASGGILGPVLAVGGAALGIGGGIAAAAAAGAAGGSTGAAAGAGAAAAGAAAAETAGGVAAGVIAGRVALGVVFGVGALGIVATLGWFAATAYMHSDRGEPEQTDQLAAFPENVEVLAPATMGERVGRVINIDDGLVRIDWGEGIGRGLMPPHELVIAPMAGGEAVAVARQ